MVHVAPPPLVYFVLEEVRSGVARGASKEKNGVLGVKEDVGVSGRRLNMFVKSDLKPFARLETKLVEVIQLLGSIMPSKEKHAVSNHTAGSSVPRRRKLYSFVFDDGPSILDEVESMEVVLVVAIVSSEDVDRVLVHNG